MYVQKNLLYVCEYEVIFGCSISESLFVSICEVNVLLLIRIFSEKVYCGDLSAIIYYYIDKSIKYINALINLRGISKLFLGGGVVYPEIFDVDFRCLNCNFCFKKTKFARKRPSKN